uniref:Uncharacterized protein n=1 Tax=Anguilla anguilla TaxID=7936 RepID=A0A0E9U2U7_ANGAN
MLICRLRLVTLRFSQKQRFY